MYNVKGFYQINKVKNGLIPFVVLFVFAFGCKNTKQKESLGGTKTENPKEKKPVFKYQEVTGIGMDSLYNRRDPSDIIQVGHMYYIWYTRMNKPVTSGYWGTIWYATSEDEGRTWQEQGMALGLGEDGAFDSHSVFTPNILSYEGKYYMYYTGVKPTPGNPEKKFENNARTDFTAIGVAIADSPDGPFKRVQNNPIILNSGTSLDFDSYRVDDASMLVRHGKIWLYYKGRCIEHGREGPKRTEMGVAIADVPEGPFEKQGSLLDKGHEVLIWKEATGISCLASISKSINHSEDGIHFTIQYDSLKNIPTAPGLYRPHLENGDPQKEIPGWGISMRQGRGEAHLLRYEIIQ